MVRFVRSTWPLSGRMASVPLHSADHVIGDMVNPSGVGAHRSASARPVPHCSSLALIAAGNPGWHLFLFSVKVPAGKPIEVFSGGSAERDFSYIDVVETTGPAYVRRPKGVICHRRGLRGLKPAAA